MFAGPFRVLLRAAAHSRRFGTTAPPSASASGTSPVLLGAAFFGGSVVAFAASHFMGSQVDGAAADTTSPLAPAAAGFALHKAASGPFQSVLGIIGDTPLFELKSLSAATGCRIMVKAEHLNPGLSVKDRAARHMVLEAEKSGKLQPGGTIVEATGGNTGIGLAMVAAARGYKTIFTMPNYVTQEKQNAMKIYGAEVRPVAPCAFSNPAHFYHQAERLAPTIPGGVFLNQFENDANFRAHYEGTAPEIWAQTGGKIDGFVCSMGTGMLRQGLARLHVSGVVAFALMWTRFHRWSLLGQVYLSVMTV